MALVLDWVTIDAVDPGALARFWAAALSFEIVVEDEEQVLLRASDGSGRRLLFVPAATPKASKNRIHLDVRPRDQAAEVARLTELGACQIDIGQGRDASWVVMADPEGNEFCVLRALRSDEVGKVP